MCAGVLRKVHVNIQNYFLLLSGPVICDSLNSKGNIASENVQNNGFFPESGLEERV